MKTQCIHIDQIFLNITNSIITSVKSFNSNKVFLTPKFSTNKIGYYLLPVARQIFRDNFMGSDMEMGMLLIFLKGYFLSAAGAIRNNAVTELYKKLKSNNSNVAVFDAERIYDHQQAA